MRRLVRQLADAIGRVNSGLLLAVTGAGASHASGIPTYRGTDTEAIWKREDITLATRDYFERDPVGQLHWYLRWFQRVEQARPNPAHDALVALERWQEARGGRFLLVTQNIDTLHEDAGSRRLVKVHGSSDRVRCSRTGCANGAPTGSLSRSEIDLEPFRWRPSRETLPRCPLCGAVLRAHVLFFDELYDEHVDYRIEEVLQAGDDAELMLFVGTSFSVGVTDLLVRAAAIRQVPLIAVDPAGSRLPAWTRGQTLAAPAEELLPAVARYLGASRRTADAARAAVGHPTEVSET